MIRVYTCNNIYFESDYFNLYFKDIRVLHHLFKINKQILKKKIFF